MSVVDVVTGEIVDLLNADDARALTDQIRASVADLRDLIVEAWRRGAWVALGYESWQDYCAAELSEVAIPKTDRPTVVQALRSVGMSTRAIGPAVGASHTTVIRDLSTGTNGPVDSPDRVMGLDGKSRPATRSKPYDPTDPATAYAECHILVGEVVERARVAVRAEMALHLLSGEQIALLVNAVRKASTELVDHLEKGYEQCH